MYTIHKDFIPHKKVSFEKLQDIMDQPVLRKEKVSNPVIISSFTLLLSEGKWYLRVRGTEGQEGMAPCSERASYLYTLLQERILPFMLGKDARDLEQIFEEIYVRDLNYKIQGLAWWCSIAWVESAVLDMLAKTANINVTDLFGKRLRHELDLYLASGNRDTTPEEEVFVLEENMAKIGGPKAIKFKLGGRMSRNKDSLAGRTEGILYLARKHFGDAMNLLADGNGSFDAAKGIEVGQILESVNGYFYEEPCPFDDLWATKAVADGLSIPVAFGEQETSLRRFAWIIEENAAQILQPDLQYAGGFLQCIKVARMADAAGIQISPHVSGGFTSYNMLLYCAVIPNAAHFHEYKGYGNASFCSNLSVKDGKVRIPDGPGLGLDLSYVKEENSQIIFDVK